MFPCNECAKLLIQAGIREVVYHEVTTQGGQGGILLRMALLCVRQVARHGRSQQHKCYWQGSQLI
jgi:deoxycytidylate deaminase